MFMLKLPDGSLRHRAADPVYAWKADPFHTPVGGITLRANILKQTLYQHHIGVAILSMLTNPKIKIYCFDRSASI